MFYVEEVGWVSQMDKYEVEEYGMLKFDFLGLINLDIITDIARRIRERSGEFTLDLDNLPLDQNVMQLYCDGDTNAVFQFESGGMKQNLRSFQPHSVEDLTILNAMYRPGPMDSIPQLIQAKKSGKITYKIPELAPILDGTYGILVYQEQVQQIFRDLAGYSLGGADLVRRAMAKKHKDKLEIERSAFLHGDEERGIAGCEKNGYDVEAANDLFDTMLKFAEYAFNLAHAAAYAYVSYITAYLKVKFPVEFYCTVIEYTKLEKVNALVEECRKKGIKVLNPDVNMAEANMSIKNGDIYYGLGKVKSVAGTAATVIAERANGKYADVADFLFRTRCKKDAFEALICAGAFDNLGIKRGDLLANSDILLESVNTITDAKKKLDEKVAIAALLEEDKTDEAKELNGGKKPVLKTLAKSIAKLHRDIADAHETIERACACNTYTNPLYLLQREEEVLGVYISASPLDGYENVAFVGNKPLTDIESRQDYVRLLMYPHDITVRKSRAGKLFAMFTGETRLGTIRVVTFEEQYAEALENVTEPIVANGYIVPDSRGNDKENEEETTFQFRLKSFTPAQKTLEDVRIRVRNVGEWVDITERAAAETETPRYRIVSWMDDSIGEIRNSDLKISASLYRQLIAATVLN